MRLARRIAYWFRLRSNHDDLINELAYHREMAERDLIAAGMSPEAARVQVKRVMGNETLMREESRAVWLWPSLEAMWQDATYTLRDLRRNPTFAAGVVLTLALGIGVNAAMFSLVDRLLFRPPATMVDPGSVHRVYMYRTSDGVERGTGGQFPRNADIAKLTTLFSQTAKFSLKSVPVGTGEETRPRNIAIVSASFFEFFNAPPVLGRYYNASEDSPDAPAPVAVLSHATWTTEYDKRRDVLGSTVRIGAVVYTVIGVAPEEFVGLWPYRPPAAFVPVTTYQASVGPRDWATNYGHSIGLTTLVRRKPKVTIAAATADLTNALRRSYLAQYGGVDRSGALTKLRPRAVAGSVLAEQGPEPSNVVQPAKWLSAVTAIVLLIACANVANLLLARTIGRRREIAVRVALGVSKARLFGQLLTEGIVLAVFGGVAGLAIGVWASGLLRATFLPGTERVSLIGDARTLLFVGTIALFTGIVTGLAPMAQVRRGSLTSDLKQGARDGTRHRTPLRTGLLLVQSALSVTLLVGAGLFVQSLRNVRDVRLGFDADSVLLVTPNMRDVRLDSAAMAALRLRLLDAVARVPGVTHATLQEAIPFGGMSSQPIFVAGIDSAKKFGEFDFNTVSSDYFATMGTRILRGRGLESSDRQDAQPVAVIGASMAAVLWPRQNPIGQCFRIGADSMPCRYVVGVAEDIHSQSIEAESRLFYYYLPAAQWRAHEGGLFVRVQGDASRLIEPVRKHLQREMPGTSYITVARLADFSDGKMRSWIVGAKVFTALGALALVLAAVGLYSVIAYNVTQRRHELGVRLALGAGRSRIVRLVVSESLRVAVAGMMIGSLIALAGERWIAPLLFHQSPRDPAVFGVVTMMLLSVAIAAAWIPALRAGSMDPKAALQSD